MIPGRHHLIHLHLIAKLPQFRIVGILGNKPVYVLQGTLIVPRGNHLIHLYLIAKLPQFTVLGILG